MNTTELWFLQTFGPQVRWWKTQMLYRMISEALHRDRWPISITECQTRQTPDCYTVYCINFEIFKPFFLQSGNINYEDAKQKKSLHHEHLSVHSDNLKFEYNLSCTLCLFIYLCHVGLQPAQTLKSWGKSRHTTSQTTWPQHCCRLHVIDSLKTFDHLHSLQNLIHTLPLLPEGSQQIPTWVMFHLCIEALLFWMLNEGRNPEGCI